ncbi:MAG TPA: LLM class F420-dependent oxidoreductase [Ktedonobacterales bacterium]|nr:LLM class F420-dependent oxidoreductase [Ktedonobacterales bacterium]
MKLILHLVKFDWAGGTKQLGKRLGEIAVTAEHNGFDGISISDHLWLHPIIGGPDGNMLEAYTTLAHLAAYTHRVRLLTQVTAVPYRHPGVLAKTVTTLDVLSGGRACLGIGAGDYEEEARGLGIPFPPLAERFEMLEETLQICLHMWSGNEQPYTGKHYQLEHPRNQPQSLSTPHPPILVGGDGERKTLRLVARYADMCSLRPKPEIPHKLDVLRRYCDEEGRDYDAIEKGCAFAFDVGDDGAKADELIGRLRWLASMGIQTVFGFVPNVGDITPLEIIGSRVIPAVAGL